MKYPALSKSCCEANQRLAETPLVDLTFGNVSCYDPDTQLLAIKPSGVDYEALTPSQIVILDLEGSVVEGELRPSSDTPTHRCLYQWLGGQGIGSIIHTHSRHAVAFAQAALDLPCLGTTHSDYFNGPVPVTRPMTEKEVEGDYEWETGAVIVERFKDLNPLEMPAVLVRNHGPFVWGRSPEAALETALALEMVAEMALATLSLNSSAPEVSEYLRQKHFSRKHGPAAYYGQG